jgi:uncharacterized protein
MNILIAIVAFISEYLDSGLGMGYGTALAPVLILMGNSPLVVIPAILLSQLFTDIAACFTHHRLGNVDLNINSFDFKTALLLGVVSSIGVIIAVIVALRIPRWMLTLYIGLLVLAMGVLIIATIKKPVNFSWIKITGLSFLASFNKGISGGGYGPLVMGGQLLSGVNPKNAVGITAFAEAITCFVGFMIYLIMGRSIDWRLTGLLCVSAIPAVPIAGLTVKFIPADKLKFYAGVLIIILGICTLLKIGSG